MHVIESQTQILFIDWLTFDAGLVNMTQLQVLDLSWNNGINNSNHTNIQGNSSHMVFAH